MIVSHKVHEMVNFKYYATLLIMQLTKAVGEEVDYDTIKQSLLNLSENSIPDASKTFRSEVITFLEKVYEEASKNALNEVRSTLNNWEIAKIIGLNCVYLCMFQHFYMYMHILMYIICIYV